jgi:3-hydroxybutyryl-CoA dehydrogenase
VGVVGAGVIGAGVAQSLAEAGRRVVVVDVSRSILDRCQQSIADMLRMQRLFRKGTVRPPDQVLANISYSIDPALLHDVDFVIENVTEKWAIKQEVYGVLNAVCPPGAVVGANTSAMPITRLASLMSHPDRVIGLHFMNPVPLKSHVEVIRGERTSAETLETATALLASMGKTGIVVKDAPGFVSNRVLMITINEAIHLVHEQVAPADDVDRIFTDCVGHKMGPLATADLIGLDTILLTLEVLHDAFKDDRFTPCPLLTSMVETGLLGRKSGQGFFTYIPPAAG